ncbi:uncharacterized protein LOC143185405 [Calliopsis andreniformis]|uniref:uncharacterized protein LOC143185405 n=1 Tax=Calliopsis andreniformis TaxID=337506 RepID=UPI003FCED732
MEKIALSTKNILTDKPTQDEICCDVTRTPMPKKMKNVTAISPESPQSKENKEIKVESKDTDEKRKTESTPSQVEKAAIETSQPESEKTPSVTENLTHCKTKPEPATKVTKTEEVKNVEQKKEKNKSECTKPKILTGTAATQTRAPDCRMIPIVSTSKAEKPSNVAVPRKCPPLSTPLLSERPLVLSTHLVPSLPISLFEVLVEAIEVATEKPVVLLYESRNYRPVAKEIVDIAILPAGVEWEDGELLPVSFCFEHPLNRNNSPCVYADIIVAKDRAPHVEDITDLRGHRCSLPDRRKQIGAAALLFNYLYGRGESPAFFGNTLDADTQVATLQMVAGKQAEVGILESPVIACHKYSLPGVESVNILTSLGPLPPYRIMVKKTLPDTLVRQITAYLLNIDHNKEWVDRFAPFGVTSFAKNSAKFYDQNDTKHVVTYVPYY